MAINPRVASVYNFTLAPRDPAPIVRGWNRLEGRPRLEDFERSLRAEVRDPLWFLTRQWQYGEFEGEDAASPVDAHIAYVTAPIDAFGVAGTAEPYDPTVPMEVAVERESAPFDLLMHVQAAQVMARLLRSAGFAARLTDLVAKYQLDYGAIAGADSEDAAVLYATGKAFLFDAQALLTAVRDHSFEAVVAAFPGLVPGEAAALVAAGDALVDWHEGTYGPPPAASPAWRPETLGYGFACSASGTGDVFAAPDFGGGMLDWHAFDVATGAAPEAPPDPVVLSFLPTAVKFGGMPSARYWEMEDSRIEFGDLDVNTNDLAALLLAEFMLVYSNDWCLFPLELDVGSFTRTAGILVTDVFGEQTLIRPADRGRDSDWQRWSMYRLDGDDAASPGLLLVPALTATVKAPPLERVQFLRDEMANMVWAVEGRVMSRLGQPFDIRAAEAPPPPVSEVPAYRLGTEVPPNWRPFVPVHLPGSTRSIRLQRARMPGQPIETAGEILRVPGTYFIAEEEVPRAGRTIERRYKRSRWFEGTSFLWIGRQVVTGRGEGSSGLVFDQVVEPAPSKS